MGGLLRNFRRTSTKSLKDNTGIEDDKDWSETDDDSDGEDDDDENAGK